MKKINEVFTITNGFFTQLKEDLPEKYAILFNDYEPTDLNIDFLSLCGERFISPVVTISDTMSVLTRIITNRYSLSWEKIKQALFADYDILSPYNINTTTTKESEVTTTNETENKNASYVYGFDSVDAVDDKTTTDTESNKGTTNDSTTNISTRVGNIGNQSQPELILAEIETRKITFLTLVMNDIKEFVTLTIY